MKRATKPVFNASKPIDAIHLVFDVKNRPSRAVIDYQDGTSLDSKNFVVEHDGYGFNWTTQFGGGSLELDVFIACEVRR